MPSHIYLALVITVGLWLSYTNLRFMRQTYRLKTYMTRRKYQRLQARHVLLSLAGLILIIASLIAYFTLRSHFTAR